MGTFTSKVRRSQRCLQRAAVLRFEVANHQALLARRDQADRVGRGPGT